MSMNIINDDRTPVRATAAAQGVNVARASVQLPDSNHWQTDLNRVVARDYQLFTTNAFGNGPECAENAPAAGGTGCGCVCACVAATSRWARYGTIRVTPRGGEGPCTACRHPRAGCDDRMGAGWTIPHSDLGPRGVLCIEYGCRSLQRINNAISYRVCFSFILLLLIHII